MAILSISSPQSADFEFRADLVERLRVAADPAPWRGSSALDWAYTFCEATAHQIAGAGYPELARPLGREELRAFCARADVPIVFRVAAAMAWGRSNVRNPGNNRKLWNSIPDVGGLIEHLSSLTRAQAFHAFSEHVASGTLRGMRASFFTKLMFFFGCPGAYILDQWMAKAVLALAAANWRPGAADAMVFIPGPRNAVRLGYGGTSIHPCMSGADYEWYCRALESLVAPLARADGADVERWLFSAPGSDWRRFLKGLDWKAASRRK